MGEKMRDDQPMETKSAIAHIINGTRKPKDRDREQKTKQTKPCEVHKLINGNEKHPTLQKHNRKQIHFCFLSVANGTRVAEMWSCTTISNNANNNGNFLYV